MKNLIKRTKDAMNLNNPDNFEIERMVNTRPSVTVRTAGVIFKRTIGLFAILLIGYHMDLSGAWWKTALQLLVAVGIWEMYV